MSEHAHDRLEYGVSGTHWRIYTRKDLDSHGDATKNRQNSDEALSAFLVWTVVVHPPKDPLLSPQLSIPVLPMELFTFEFPLVSKMRNRTKMYSHIMHMISTRGRDY
jgi:hypothetical protein